MKVASGKAKPNQLIVEGYDDLYSVVGLMRHHVPWPADPAEAPVNIQIGKSADEILEDGYLTALLKSPTVKRLGVMFDADDKPAAGRYTSIRKQCLDIFPSLPATMPSIGLVAQNTEQKRLGVWIMPDNLSPGDLETFLRYFVPDQSESVWKSATVAVIEARKLGACWRDCHQAKANLYTWLAWQDPPSQKPGEALTKKILNPYSSNGDQFLGWFRSLYEL